MQHGVNNKQMNSFIDHLLHDRGLSRKSAQDVKIVLGNILKYGSMEHDIPLFTYMIEYPTASMEKQHDLHYFTREQCKVVFKAMDDDPSGELLGIRKVLRLMDGASLVLNTNYTNFPNFS